MTEPNTNRRRVPFKTWGTPCFVLGNTALFALLGWWAGSLSDYSRPWTTFVGAVLGFAMGTSFRRRLK